MNNISCPNCGVVLSKEVKKKTKCQHCDKYMYIRKGQLLNEHQAQIDDWKPYMEFLAPIDIDLYAIETEKTLAKQFNRQPSADDVVWRMFNGIIERLNSYFDLSMIYENMAKFSLSKGDKAQWIELKDQAVKYKMLEYQNSESSIKSIKVRSKDDGFVCKECHAMNNQIRSIADVGIEPNLPYKKCLNKECRCWYDLLSDYDLEDNARSVNKSGQLNPDTNGDFSCVACGTNMGKPKMQNRLFGGPKYYLYCQNCRANYSIRS